MGYQIINNVTKIRSKKFLSNEFPHCSGKISSSKVKNNIHNVGVNPSPKGNLEPLHTNFISVHNIHLTHKHKFTVTVTGNCDQEIAEYKATAGQAVIQHDLWAHPTALNKIIARAVDGDKNKIEHYHANYLDHVYAVSNSNGNIIEHYRYSAFGEVEIYSPTGQKLKDSAIANYVRWNKRREDPLTGLLYYKYRHYSPRLARWLGRDPIEEAGGVNLYNFVENSPLDYWDKWGWSANQTVKKHSKSCLEFIKKIKHNMTAKEVKLMKVLCCCSPTFKLIISNYSKRPNAELQYVSVEVMNRIAEDATGTLQKNNVPYMARTGKQRYFWSQSLSTTAHEIVHVFQIAKEKNEKWLPNEAKEYLDTLEHESDSPINKDDHEARRAQRIIRNEAIVNCPSTLKFGGLISPSEHDRQKIKKLQPSYIRRPGKSGDIGYYNRGGKFIVVKAGKKSGKKAGK